MTDERPTVRDLLVAQADATALALVHGDQRWSWQEYVAESSRRAHWLLAQRVQERPFHVGLLAGNTDDHACWLAACALAGAVAVGLNPTRSASELTRDAAHAEVLLVLVDTSLDVPFAPNDLPVVAMDDPALRTVVAGLPEVAPDVDVDADDLCMLIFTSGTTSDPKAVRCSHGRLAHSGSMVGMMAELGEQDVVLVSMPLFHSNAVIAGWIAAMSVGAAMVVRDFSASGFVADLRRHAVTYANYVGKPLSYLVTTDVQPNDEHLPLRVVFGNEANEDDIHAFAQRFGCRVIDAYGSTEGGISLLRTDQTPRGSLGVGIGDIRVLDDNGEPCPPNVVGELVNMDGPGGFEGYWNNSEADAQRLRTGRFHSGDLAWRDEDGFFWFAGRTGEWLRVDGENLAVAPIERTLVQHPDIRDASVMAVPDEKVGDQVLAWLEVHDVDAFDVTGFGDWCASRDDLTAKSLPRFVRVAAALPRTPTNKIVRRELRERGLLRRDGDGPVWIRSGRGTAYGPLEES